MDIALFAIMFIPVVISLIAKFVLKWDISWGEFSCQMIVGAIAIGIIWAAGNYQNTRDVEILNGAVTRKDVNRFTCPTNTSNPCRNGYSCNCYDVCSPQYDDKGNLTGQSCVTHCDTCYRYPWEQDWYVRTNLGNYEISRVDAQGARVPPRWDSTKVGDPVSKRNTFKNWLKVSSANLFRDADSGLETYKDILPEYPSEVFDYYRIDRIVTPNVRLTNEAKWNSELSRTLAILGPVKEINAIFVFVEGKPRDYAYALRRKWLGFKQNDAVVVLGLAGGKVDWVETMSWSKNEVFNVEMSRRLGEYKGTNIAEVSPEDAMKVLWEVAGKSFERRPMEDFEYLKHDAKAPKWVVVLTVFVALIFGVATSYYFHNIDLGRDLFTNKRYHGNNRYRNYRNRF